MTGPWNDHVASVKGGPEPFPEPTSASAPAMGRPEVRSLVRLRPGQPAALTPGTVIALVTINVLVLADLDVPVVRPVLGLWLLLIGPARRLAAKLAWGVDGTERRVLAITTTLFGVMFVHLVSDVALPLMGVARPLDPVPVVIVADVVLLGLTWWRPDVSLPRISVPRFAATGLHVPWPLLDVLVIGIAFVSLLLAVAGATRLNNGGGGQVTVVALVFIVETFALALIVRQQVQEPTLHLLIYLQSLSLLLMTSLRGWTTTGHDVQGEFRFLQLVARAGHWDASRSDDAYNACLSITVLPTVISNVVGGDLASAFKIYTQLIFALVPVIVFLIARRSGNVGVALLGVIFFVAFPTFFSDMPYLNRQEVAFVFLAAAVLVILQTETGLVRRRTLFAVLTVGTVISHYSTTYVLIGVVLMSPVVRSVTKAISRMLPQRANWRQVDARMRPRKGRLVVGWLNIVALMVSAFAWSTLITDTGGHLVVTLRDTMVEIVRPGSTDARSSDVGYSIVGADRRSPEQRFADFRAETIKNTVAARSHGEYLPLAEVNQFPTKLVKPDVLALTSVGRALQWAHIDVEFMNGLIRSSAARLLQIFVCVGLVVAGVGAARRFVPPPELVSLGVASLAVVVAQVLLPGISVEYGVLRAFQQSLIVLAPFLAVGAMTCLRWFGPFASRATAAFAVVFLASLTGLIPQITGGYPPQLHLNNSGVYYDSYYPHPEEHAAVAWLRSRVPGVNRRPPTEEVEGDIFTANRLWDIPVNTARLDIFPTLVRTKNYVFIPYATVSSGKAFVVYAGDGLRYEYPIGLLRKTKSLVYDNGGAEIYR